MHTRAAETGTVDLAKDVASHAGAIGRLELKLALAELKEKAAAFGLAAALAVAAAVCALFGIGFAAATVAAGLATVLPIWLALLIVTVAFVAAASTLGLLCRAALQRATPPVPVQALDEARRTREALRADGDSNSV
jgi:hypothetical protein